MQRNATMQRKPAFGMVQKGVRHRCRNGPPAQLGLNQDEIFGLFDIKSRPAQRQAA